MDDHLRELAEGINRWRERGIRDYWVSVSYIGSAVNRFGDHDLQSAGGKLYHLWEGEWREIARGSDFWLFSVPGAFAWARDVITQVLPEHDAADDTADIVYDDDFGHVKRLRVSLPDRDAHNFSFEVRRFRPGRHPQFRE